MDRIDGGEIVEKMGKSEAPPPILSHVYDIPIIHDAFHYPRGQLGNPLMRVTYSLDQLKQSSNSSKSSSSTIMC